VSASDRTTSLGLFAGAAVAWLGVAWALTSLSPVGSPAAQIIGAMLLGGAVALTACPILWRAAAWRHTESAGGSWSAAGRRAGLIGLVVSVLVLLRAIDALALPVLVFLVVTAVLVEAAFTIRR
jgi:hypothetical protein